MRHTVLAVSGPCTIRKPLHRPSELRGHGSATEVNPFDLGEAALALSQRPLAGLAYDLATVSDDSASDSYRRGGDRARERPGASRRSSSPPTG